MTQWQSSMNTYRRLLFTIAPLFGLAAMAWAGWNEGVAAYNQGDYATTYREFLPLAQQGNSQAQVRLGSMYHFGRAVPQDYAEAMKWYRKAVNQGDALGQTAIGVMYHDGHGVPQDYTEAAQWFRKAADPGDTFGQVLLGGMYYKGNGVPQDYVQAHLWFNLAASRLPPGDDQETAAKERDRVAEKMTPAQIAEAQGLARQWKQKQP